MQHYSKLFAVVLSSFVSISMLFDSLSVYMGMGMRSWVDARVLTKRLMFP